MYLEFEQEVMACEDKLHKLEALPPEERACQQQEIERLKKKISRLLTAAYKKLTAWDRVLLARHLDRPHTVDYIRALMEEFVPLAGDRVYGEDAAILGGLARFEGQTVVVMGQEKGRETAEKIHHNFGMPRPEGYRKVQRLLALAEQFQMPVVTFVDTSGAYPGLEGEERGVAEAIAGCLASSLALTVPVVSVIIGEGGSGGAVALAVANRVLMLENAIYSVISPEGAASILWRTADKKKEAAEALKMTAADLKRLGVVDEVIPEPLGGAHRGQVETIRRVGAALAQHLQTLGGLSGAELKTARTEKFLAMGLNFVQ